MTATTVAPPRRSPRGRAALAVLLLLGFYVLALGLLAALAGLNVLFFANGRVPVRLLIFSAIVGYALLRGMFFVERRGAADEVTGIPVTDAQEPRLWALVREVAAALGTDPPGRLYLVPDVNAFVFQRSRLLGLVPGERVMGIGVPLLHVLSVDELRGVVAHEFGHYTGGDTRLGPLVYRGRASIGRTIEHLGDDSLIASVFRAYGKLYLRVSQAVSRRQELDADANAAHLVGPAAHASGLRRLHVAAPVFDTFLGRYVEPLWEGGATPRDLYAGFRQFHDHPDHAEQLERLAASIEAAPGDRYDSHPPLGARLAALGVADTAAAPVDDPARALLADPDAVDVRMTDVVSRAVSTRGLRPVEWDDAAAAAICAPVAQAESDRLRNAVSALTGRPATLGDAFDMVENRQVARLAAALEPRVGGVEPARREKVEQALVADAIAGTVSAALTASRGWRWSLRWAGAAALVSPEGEPWDPAEAVAAAVADPARVPALRTELRARGVAA